MKLRFVLVLLVLALTACASDSGGYQADRKRSAEANAELGLRYMLQGKNDIAMEKLKRALDEDPHSALAHHYLAELDRRLEQNEQADYHYRKAADYATDDALASSIHNNYGVFLCSQKQYDKAEKQFQEALKNPVYTGRADSLENMGACMYEAGNLKLADEYLRKALKLEPQRPMALLYMAELSFRNNNVLSARAYLQRYNEVAPPNPESLWLGIRVERVLGDKNALASYGMLLKNNFPEAEQTRLYLKSQER